MNLAIFQGAAEAVNAVAQVVKTFAESIQGALRSGLASYDLVKARTDQGRLRDILANTSIYMEGTLRPALEAIDRFIQNPDPNAWTEIRTKVQECLQAVEQLLEGIKATRGDFILEDEYQTFLGALYSRQAVLSSFLSIQQPPSSEEEMAELKLFLVNYQTLIESLNTANDALADYLKQHTRENTPETREQ